MESLTMEKIVFDNEYFEKWLDEKCAEILKRIQSEKLSTEDMVLLCLKAQTNHFHHMDGEFRDEFKSIRQEFKEIHEQFREIDQRFKQIDQRFEKIDQRFDEFQKQIDKRFDRQNYVMMWGFALFITTQMAIFYQSIGK